MDVLEAQPYMDGFLDFFLSTYKEETQIDKCLIIIAKIYTLLILHFKKGFSHKDL